MRDRASRVPRVAACIIISHRHVDDDAVAAARYVPLTRGQCARGNSGFPDSPAPRCPKVPLSGDDDADMMLSRGSWPVRWRYRGEGRAQTLERVRMILRAGLLER